MKRRLKDIFIPHEGNDYKPHSLQKAAMVGLVVMILLSFTLSNLQSVLWTTSEWMVSSVLPSVIVDLTNKERSAQSLSTLHRNPKLDAAAKLKAQHMAEKGYFAHFSPSGVSPWYWFGQVHYNFVNAGENLAIHFTDSDEVVKAWMKSPTHRANIVNGKYTEIGVGTARGKFEGYDTVFVVQLFGTPAVAPTVAGKAVSVTPVAKDSEVLSVTASTSPPNNQVKKVDSLPTETSVVTEAPFAPDVGALEQTQAPTASPSQTTAHEVVEQNVLAEEVAITQQVNIVTADPLPIDDTLQAEVVHNQATDTPEIVFSSFISTSTNAIPASIDPIDTSAESSVPFVVKIATQPTTLLELLYKLIALFVVISLALSIGIEIRRQHPVQIAYSIALLFLMFGLFKVHALLSVGAVIL